MVIVIMGVVGSMVSVFMKSPIDAYFSSARRAAMTDMADTASRRMARDLHKALPNSVRVASSNQCLEFIPTKAGARYRADDTSAGLDFAGDTDFNLLAANSTLVDQQIRVGDLVAVYNLGIPGADAYAGDNTAAVTAIAATGLAGSPEMAITIANKKFPLSSPSHRLYVIPAEEQIVAYVCSGTASAPGHMIRSVRPLSAAANICATTGTGVSSALLARNATCSFDYDGADLQRNGLVSMVITMSEADESVRLHHDVHVNNAP